MQVTGLGNPHLLERVSNTLNQMRSLFKAFDQDSDGYITKEEFAKVQSLSPRNILCQRPQP